MTISYVLEPIPKWLFNDTNGNPLGGGKMYVYRNLARTERKFVYQDAGGQLEYPQPILFNAAGQAGPFYWKIDTDSADELYYLEVYDSDNVLQFTIEGYPVSQGSGGGTVTTVIDTTNYIVNNTFDYNVVSGGSALNVSSLTNALLAPGAHQGFTQPTSNLLGGDIRFVKNATGATDSVDFPSFGFGDNSLTPDQTPTYYCQLTCSVAAGGGETYKKLQIAVNKGLQNFSGEMVTLTFWAKSTALNKTVDLEWYYFYGDGSSATAGTNKSIQQFTLTATWAQYSVTTTMPSVSGDNQGECGNDLLFLNFAFPVNATFVTQIAKPSMYLGNSFPTTDYEDPDEVAAITDAPRTGDIRMSMNSFSPFGWVALNDGTIGNDGSIGGTVSNASTRSNVDTYALYELIHNNYNNTLAPVYTNAGVPTTRGADAATDFENGVQLQLTRVLGRVLAGAWGGSDNAGTAVKSSATTISSVDTGTDELTLADGSKLYTGNPIEFSTTGTLPTGLTAAITYYVIKVSANVIKVATTAANAIAGTAVDITGSGTGTNTVTTPAYTLGETAGNETHTLTSTELPDPLTTGASGSANFVGANPSNMAITLPGGQVGTVSISNNNGGNAHNIMQNTAFMNIFAKL